MIEYGVKMYDRIGSSNKNLLRWGLKYQLLRN